VILRRTRGQLVTRSRDGTVRVTAKGRGDWIGSLELRREAVNEDATRNTARVVGDMAADVLAVIEAEDRPALQRFQRGFAAVRLRARHTGVALPTQRSTVCEAPIIGSPGALTLVATATEAPAVRNSAIGGPARAV
jgi:hypothetical protein